MSTDENLQQQNAEPVDENKLIAQRRELFAQLPCFRLGVGQAKFAQIQLPRLDLIEQTLVTLRFLLLAIERTNLGLDFREDIISFCAF